MPTARRHLTLATAADLVGAAGFAPHPFGVGLELEWFVNGEFGNPVTDIPAMRSALEAEGPLPHESRITFEPGGQVELSTPPSADGPSALLAADADAAAARTRLGVHGLTCCAVGVDAGGPRPRVLDEPRYRAMDQYFARQGRAGATMMRNTASLQINVGYAPDVDAQWDFAHDLAPVLAAMFAHSPLVAGRPTGWQSNRLATWAALDPGRTRPVGGNDLSARAAWTRYALAAPVMLVRHDPGGEVPEPAPSLASWIEHGYRGWWPDEHDVTYHLTTLFPPIRPRGWLELRMIDALPDPWWRVAAAVTITTLTDPDTRAFLTPVLTGARDLWLAAAWHGIHDPALGAMARAVMATVTPALARAGYPASVGEEAREFHDRYVARGRSLADELLDRHASDGALAPAPEPIPTTSR